MSELFKKIPNMNTLIDEIKENYPIDNDVVLKESITQVLDELRKAIAQDLIEDFSLLKVYEDIYIKYLSNEQYNHRKCINATGIIIHTNLGRSILSEKQLENIDVLKGYNNLEFDINKQKRGSRYSIVEEAICKICQCESALVVNNNAAAVMIILNEFAQNKEVIVSNSELVEIGGSFRIPEIINLSGAIMKNIGTTNKTKLADYYDAVNDNTGLLAKIHQSNFYIEGFVASVSAKELVDYRNENNLDLIIYEDLASGAVFDLSKYGLDKEPTIIDSVKSGVDIISFSGDKLLGGVQAGIIIGKKEYIDRLKKNQLLRALRPSGIILNIVESTFKNYVSEDIAAQNIPTFKYLTERKEVVLKKAEYIYEKIKNSFDCTIIETKAAVGGGCMPKTKVASCGIAFKNNIIDMKNYLASRRIPIIAIITEEQLILDCKVIADDDLDYIINVLNEFSHKI